MTPTEQTILELAARPMLGCRPMDVPGTSDVWRTLKKMHAKGWLVRCSVSYKDVRYFTTQELSDGMRVKRSPVQSPSVTIRDHRKREGWGADDPMHITPQTKYTFAPKPPERVYRTNTYT